MMTKKEQRLRRARQTRIRIATQGVARLTVNRTNLHIYASVVSGDGARVLATASTLEADVRGTRQGGSESTDTEITTDAPIAARPIGYERWRGVRVDVMV